MCKFGSWSRTAISLLICGFLLIATISLVAGQSFMTAPDRNLKNPAWTVPYSNQSEFGLNYLPDYGPKIVPQVGSGTVWNLPDFSPKLPGDGFVCLPTTFKVPRSHIGLYNSSRNQINIILYTQKTGQTNVPKVVVLEVGEVITIECDGCQIMATVPKGGQLNTGDYFWQNLTGGRVYTPSYVAERQRWELSLQPALSSSL